MLLCCISECMWAVMCFHNLLSLVDVVHQHDIQAKLEPITCTSYVQFALLRRNISPLVSISRCRLKYSIDTHVQLQFSCFQSRNRKLWSVCDKHVISTQSYLYCRLVLSFSSLSFFWQVLFVHLQIFLDDQSFRLVYCSRYPEEELGNAYNNVQTITSSKYYSFPFASCSSL